MYPHKILRQYKTQHLFASMIQLPGPSPQFEVAVLTNDYQDVYMERFSQIADATDDFHRVVGILALGTEPRRSELTSRRRQLLGR